MRWAWILLLLGGVGLGQQLQTRSDGQTSAQATAAATPQTPRQVLVEILRAKDGSALERHLPEITKKKMKEMGGGMGGRGFDIPDMFGGIQVWSAQARNSGAKIDIEEAGPALMTVDDPRTKERLEVIVENDDLAGDEDDVQLGFRMTKAGEEEMAHWFAPRILLHMKQEQGIWRFEEIGFSAKAPIGDEEFLDAMEKQVKKQQEATRGMMPRFALNAVNAAEAQYLKLHGTYSCSVAELDAASRSAPGAGAWVQGQADMLKQYQYELKLSGCSGAGYTVTVVPSAGSTGKAFCSDQTKKLRFAADGKAETCVERGETVTESLDSDDHVTGIAINPNP